MYQKHLEKNHRRRENEGSLVTTTYYCGALCHPMLLQGADSQL